MRVYLTMGGVALFCLLASLWMARGMHRGWFFSYRGLPLHEGSTMAEQLAADDLAAEVDALEGDGPRCRECRMAQNLHCGLHSPRCCPGRCSGVPDPGFTHIVAHHGIAEGAVGRRRPDRTARRLELVDDDISRAASRAAAFALPTEGPTPA